MKKLSFVFAFAFVLMSVSLFGACSRNDNYLAVIPTDQDYKATLSYHSEIAQGGYDYYWEVIRKSVEICGEQRQVIYVKYFCTNLITNSVTDKTLMFVSVNDGVVLALNGTSWEKHTGSFGDKWSDIYGSMSKPGSFVYEMTDDINGTDFPKRYKVETTSEYIKYDFGKYNEVFKISNNMYHVLLFYSFDNNSTHILKEATLTLGTPADTIGYLDTITPEMLGEN